MRRAVEPLPRGLIIGLASGVILVPLNSTMLAVALPSVMDEFGLDANSVTSLVSFYLGAMAIALPVGGTLADRFGPGRMFLAGVLGFGAASLFATVTASFAVLQVARVLQAAAGALVSTAAVVLLRTVVPASRRGEAFGVLELLVSSSAMAGPFIGGVALAVFGWRMMFLLAVPIALASAGLVGVILPRRRTGLTGLRPTETEANTARLPLDVAGLVLLALAIVAFLVALRGGDLASSPIAILAALAMAPLLAMFVLLELRREHPAIDLRMVRQLPFAAAVAGVFGSAMVLHGTMILVPLLVERLLDETSVTSGLLLLAFVGLGALVAPIGGRASDRRGRRVVAVAGSLVMTAGLVALAQPLAAGAVGSIGLLVGVAGLGMGLAGSPRHAAALESSDPDRAGMAAATYYMSRYLGGLVGATLAGAVVSSAITFAEMSTGFGLLAVTALLVALVSVGLPGRPASTATRRPSEIAGSVSIR